MFRTTATRAVPSTLFALRTPAARTNIARIAQQAAFRTSTRPTKFSPVLALAVQKPIQKSLVRYASGKVVLGQDTEGEKRLQSEKVTALPDDVTEDSEQHNATVQSGAKPEGNEDVDMMAGIRGDFVRPSKQE